MFSLANDVLVYSAHDCRSSHVSSKSQERQSLEEFMKIMAKLDLPYPKFMDYEVPGNKPRGICPCDLPENLVKHCRHTSESPPG